MSHYSNHQGDDFSLFADMLLQLYHSLSSSLYMLTHYIESSVETSTSVDYSVYSRLSHH